MRTPTVLLMAVILVSLFGCGSDKDRLKNKDLDRPKPAADK